MQAAILAGGLATRLRPITDGIPKSLVPVNGRPFLEYQLEFLKQGQINKVLLCVGHLGEQIEKYFGNGANFGLDIKYSYEKDRLLGTAGALKNAQKLLDDAFFVLYGDSYLFVDFPAIMTYFRQFNLPALMTVYKNADRFDRSNIVIQDNLVVRYSKTEKAPGMVYIDYGASLLRRETLAPVPAGQAYSLEELFAPLINEKKLLAYEVDRRFYQIGSPDGLNEFREYIRQSEVRP